MMKRNGILILMRTRTLKQLLLYNYRYFFVYSLITVFILYFLFWQFGYTRMGISQLEIATAARHLSLKEILHFPIYPAHSLLQWAILKYVDINRFTISLPSVLISLVTSYYLYLMLKKWFGKSTALLSTTFLISADWFLFFARHGSGMIEFSMWLALALSCFTKLIERRYVWLLILAVSLSGLLFAPLGIYAVICLMALLFFSKVFRERALEAPLILKVSSIIIILTSFIAVAVLSYYNINFVKTLIGINNFPGILGFTKNIFYNTASIVSVLPLSNPEYSPVSLLYVRFFELAFIIFGVMMLYKTRVNRLNYAVIVLSVVLVITSGFMSNLTGSSLLFVPSAIFITAGIRHLMHRWRQTFPSNPYARVVAYVPLSFLFICVTLLHYQSYFYLWPSQTAVHQVYTRDFRLLKNELNSGKNNQQCLVLTSNTELQKLISAAKTKCQPVFEINNSTNNIDRIITHYSSSEFNNIKLRYPDSKVLVSEVSENNVRWLVSKPQQTE